MSLDATIRDIVQAEVEKRFAEVRREREAGESGDDWISQSKSPLGRKLHTKLCRLGALPGTRLHRRWLVRRRDLDAYVLKHGIPAAKPEPTTPSNDNTEASAFARSRSGLRRIA